MPDSSRDVVATCPVTGRDFKVGLRSDAASFARSTMAGIFRCSECQARHRLQRVELRLADA